MKFQLNSALGATAMVLIGNLACSAQNSGGDVSSSIKQQGGEPPPQGAPPQASPQRQAALPAKPAPADSQPLSISPPNADQGDTVDVAPDRKHPENTPAPTEEIIMGLPRVMPAEDDGAPPLPEDAASLKKRAKAELLDGNTDDALSIIDVLLVMNPEDAELLEIRGDIMLKRDLKEDAAVDFKRCCKLGRQTCCR